MQTKYPNNIPPGNAPGRLEEGLGKIAPVSYKIW